MNISHLKNIYNSFAHRDRSKLRLTPYKEWGIILGCSTLLFVAVSIVGYGVYDRYFVHGVVKEFVVATTTPESDIEILTRDVEDRLEYFKNKEERHAKLLLEQGHPRNIMIATTTQDMPVNATTSTSTATSTR